MKRASLEYMPDAALLADLAQPFPDQSITLPDGQVKFVPTEGNYVLANPALPINQKRDEIVGLMLNHRPFITATATGSGKTLGLPMMAFETDEFDRIWVTQPTILGARNAAARLTTELNALGVDGEDIVGYRTANEGTLNERHRIAYVTPKLYTEMLLSGVVGKKDLGILDEFHMRQAGTDVAFTLNHMQGVQTVISSATIDTEYIARRAREMTGKEHPIVIGPGRRYPVDERVEPVLVSQAIIDVVKEFRDAKLKPPKIAVVLPGDQAIRDVRGAIHRRLPSDMAIYRLTGESSRRQQEKAMADYSHGSVTLATNVIETSLTIPNLQVVIDSLYRRTGHFKNGVKRLPLEIASIASQDQVTGRVGRTEAGIRIQAMLDGYSPAPVFFEEGVSKDNVPRPIVRDETPSYVQPEIECVDLSDLEIRLAARGMSLGTMSLLTEPRRHAIEGARSRLRRLDAIDYSTGEVTEIGEQIAKLNVDTGYARMVAEALLHGERTALQMIAAVSALQMKGIGTSGLNQRRWLELTNEKDSDLLAQLDVMLAAMSLDDDEKATFNIIDHRFENAFTLAKSLAERVGLDFNHVAAPTESERQTLVECLIMGSLDVFVKNGKRTFKGRNGDRRTLTGMSVIAARKNPANIVMGEAIDIGVMSKRHGLRMRRALKMATAVNIRMLDQTIPSKMSRRLSHYDISKTGNVFGVQDVFFDTIKIGKETRQIKASAETDTLLIDSICEKRRVEGTHPKLKQLYAAIDELKELQDRTADDLELRGLNEHLLELLSERAPMSILSLEKLSEVISPKDIRAYVSSAKTREIIAAAPNEVEIKIEDDARATLDVVYIKNIAYVRVLPQHVPYIPDELTINGRKTFLHVEGYRNHHLTIAQAKEHVSRESRRYRRNGESEASANRASALTAETAAEVAGRLAVSIEAQKIIIVGHFKTKKDTKRKPRKNK